MEQDLEFGADASVIWNEKIHMCSSDGVGGVFDKRILCEFEICVWNTTHVSTKQSQPKFFRHELHR